MHIIKAPDAIQKLTQMGDVTLFEPAEDGLFLASGIIKGGVTMQDKIIDTAEIIRKKYDYRGYLHLKIMPSAERDQIQRAMQLADRISINLEAPTTERLYHLAPKKEFNSELLHALQMAHSIKQENPRIKASVVTQFVGGAVGILTSNCYRSVNGFIVNWV